MRYLGRGEYAPDLPVPTKRNPHPFVTWKPRPGQLRAECGGADCRYFVLAYSDTYAKRQRFVSESIREHKADRTTSDSGAS